MTSSDKLLVVDDNKDQQGLVQGILKGVLSRDQILYATDGIEGLKTALTERPRLILTDLNMHQMNGDRLIVELRKEQGYLPHIVLSSDRSLDLLLSNKKEYAIDDQVKVLIQDGEIDFLPKSFDFNVYSKALEALVGRYLLPADTATQRFSS
ncbi:MAG TPA: response regulator [Candidatus Nanoarchaeia archaeon]|nr:response regulator [Candidatus Nanoarchaeia archaeon]